MTQVLRQRRWRLTLSLLAMVAWLLGTNFCALGLMARPCNAPEATPTVAACPHCPAAETPAAPVAPVKASCCQETLAGLPPAITVGLPLLSWSAAFPPADWPELFSLALASAPGQFPVPVRPDTGPPPAGGEVMRVLLGRCAPVHAPPVSA